MSAVFFSRSQFRLPCDLESIVYDPERGRDPYPVALIALHGYGSTPEAIAKLLIRAIGTELPILALRGPNQFHVLGAGAADPGYNWGIPAHLDSNVRLHHQMVTFAAEDLQRRFGTPPSGILLAGFSQPVAFNYRFLATYPEQVGGAIGLCGGVPHDWETGGPFGSGIGRPVLHISRDADEHYPAEKAQAFPARLRKRIDDVEFHMLPGPHRFPSESAPLLRDWIARKFRAR